MDAHVSEALRALATASGVQLAYTDLAGQEQTASDEALLAVLEVLGVDLARPEGAAERLAELEADRARALLPPVTVAWVGHDAALHLRLPPGSPRRVEGGVALEDGSTVALAADLEPGDAPAADGSLRHRLPLPPDLPVGYHRVRLSAAGRLGEGHLLVAPEQAFAPDDAGRDFGVVMPLYALQGRAAAGLADLSDLEALVGFAARHGAKAVGTLPLLASFLDTPFEPSPYAPVSRLFFNELYLDLERVPELAAAPQAREILASGAWRTRAEAVRDAELVDYREAGALVHAVLQPLADAAFDGTGPRRDALDAYLHAHPEAEDYALFRGALEAEGAAFWSWPAAMRDGEIPVDAVDQAAWRRHLFAQFALAEQLEGLAGRARDAGTELYLDLPVGVHPDGYDVWRERDAFALGLSAGAPPDPFFTGGQDWGFPPLHPARSRQTGHHYFAACVRAHMRYAGRLRIDHVMGLHRLFWVPRGLGPKQGVYVRYPAEELWAVVCIESHRHRTRVVGENLGTVPEAVNEALGRHRIGGMYVAQFAVGTDPGQAVQPPPAGSTASFDTHDTPTFAGWWHGDDIGQRVDLGFLDPGAAEHERGLRRAQVDALKRWLAGMGLCAEDADEIACHQALLTWLGSTDAGTVLVNLEDVWAERHPQNVPGTHREVPNWRHKARQPLDALEHMDAARDLLEALARARHTGSP